MATVVEQKDQDVLFKSARPEPVVRGGGIKYDELKPRFDLIPPGPLTALAEVYSMGAAKYSARQWEHGMEWGRLYAAAQRHMNAFWAGQDLDEESALPHLAHAAWNLFALMEYMETHLELDDRPQT